MEIKQAIEAVILHTDLDAAEMTAVMRQIMTGEATPAQIGAFLVALRMKGETVEEIASAAAVMRELATPVNIEVDHLVDTCGTGGDSSATFNISTCSAFVSAAAGAKVAKHGNRSISSRSGSADVLETAGVKLDMSADQVAECIRQTGVGFMFAPMHHGAMKHAIGPRRELGTRTIFNLLGPLTNPASAPNQVLGVFSVEWVLPLANVLKSLGSSHVMVVHAEDGMDELSISAPSRVAELNQGEITSYTVTPEELGLQRQDDKVLKVDGAAQSLEIFHQVFSNTAGAARDIVALNAGAAIYASGVAGTLEDGVQKALAAIADGGARRTFDAYVEYSRSLS